MGEKAGGRPVTIHKESRPGAVTPKRLRIQETSILSLYSQHITNPPPGQWQIVPGKDIFRQVRERVSAQDAARRYGLAFDRQGRARCPFHNDKHPSMSFKDGRFRCWVCDIGGDAIDLTARLWGLDKLEAAKRLNEDFALALPLGQRPTQEEVRQERKLGIAYQNFTAWREGLLNRMCQALRVYHRLKLGPQGPTPAQAAALSMGETLEHWYECLAYGQVKEQLEVYREKEGVEAWVEKILQP